jgi:hypothetical protein
MFTRGAIAFYCLSDRGPITCFTEQVYAKYPVFCRYEDEWPIRDYIHQYISIGPPRGKPWGKVIRRPYKAMKRARSTSGIRDRPSPSKVARLEDAGFPSGDSDFIDLSGDTDDELPSEGEYDKITIKTSPESVRSNCILLAALSSCLFSVSAQFFSEYIVNLREAEKRAAYTKVFAGYQDDSYAQSTGLSQSARE